MRYITATYTDIGKKKETNQDSMLVLQATSPQGKVLFAAMCDGMGGLAKGEVASAAIVNVLDKWFTGRLPAILEQGITPALLWREWKRIITITSQKIAAYGEAINASLGTTCAAVLIIEDRYFIMNVGDSRVYLISDKIHLLTKDQTFVQREVDAGRMTYEQSLVDPRMSVLLQCIGASPEVEPVFSEGRVTRGQVFMLCCDGFRHVVTPQEFYQAFRPDVLTDRSIMEQKLKEITELNLARGETDNISAILVKLD